LHWRGKNFFTLINFLRFFICLLLFRFATEKKLSRSETIQEEKVIPLQRPNLSIKNSFFVTLERVKVKSKIFYLIIRRLGVVVVTPKIQALYLRPYLPSLGYNTVATTFVSPRTWSKKYIIIVAYALLSIFRATIFFAFTSSNSFQTGCHVLVSFLLFSSKFT